MFKIKACSNDIHISELLQKLLGQHISLPASYKGAHPGWKCGEILQHPIRTELERQQPIFALCDHLCLQKHMNLMCLAS